MPKKRLLVSATVAAMLAGSVPVAVIADDAVSKSDTSVVERRDEVDTDSGSAPESGKDDTSSDAADGEGSNKSDADGGADGANGSDTGATDAESSGAGDAADGTVTNDAANADTSADSAAQADAAAFTLPTLEELAAKLDELAAGKDLAALATDQEYVHVLLQHRLVQEAGYDNLKAAMEEAENGEAFTNALAYLMGDYELLGYYVYGGPPEVNYGDASLPHKLPDAAAWIRSLKVFSKLYAKHGADLTTGSIATDTIKKQADPALIKRLMVAISHTHATKVEYWTERSGAGSIGWNWRLESEPVERYEIYKRLYENSLLVEEFDRLTVAELRMVTGVPVDNDQLQWLNYYYHAKVWKNTDYLTNPKQFTLTQGTGAEYGKLGPSFGGMFPYGAYNSHPERFGGLGDRFFDYAKQQEWTDKYGLTVHDGVYEFDVKYGYSNGDPNTGQVYCPLWVLLETNGVCEQISWSSTVAYGALGIPASHLYQPAHASFLVFQRDARGRGVYGSGYDIYGFKQSGKKNQGDSYLPAGWGDLSWASFYNIDYGFIGIEAMDSYEDWVKAENLSMMGDRALDAGDASGAIDAYEAAFKAQNINLSAWDGLQRAYQDAASGKTDEDWYDLALIAAGKDGQPGVLSKHPLVMYDYLNTCIVPNIESKLVRFDVMTLLYNALDLGSNLDVVNTWDVAQPREVRLIASHYLGAMTKIASFSFDTGAISVNSSWAVGGGTLEYSFDGGTTWGRFDFDATNAAYELSDEELASITDENDILYRFVGARDGRSQRIYIGTGAKPPTNAGTNIPDDNEDRFLSLQSGLEYSTDAGATWHALTNESTFEGDVTVWVRRRATGTTLPSPHFEVAFTQSEGTPERSYIKAHGNLSVVSGPLSTSGNVAANAIDGKTGTYWQNAWANINQSAIIENGVISPRHTYEFVFKLSKEHYLSGLTYLPATIKGELMGAILGLEVYTSDDGETWQLVGSAKNWSQDGKEKSLDFDQPGYCTYIKIKTTKVQTKELSFHPMKPLVGYASAAEFKFYENYAVKSKAIKELKLTTSDMKTSYKVGDKLDLNGLTAQVVFEDGATALIPATMLTYDVDVLNEAGKRTVTATYEGHTATFDIEVAENDRKATEISSVTLRDRVYYAGDDIAPEDIEVAVTDGSSTWYLLPGEYTIDSALLQGEQIRTVTAGELSKEFSVTAQAAATGLTLSTTDEFRKQYALGEAFDATGLTVTLRSESVEDRVLEASEYTIEAYQVKADGTKADDKPIPVEDITKTPGSKRLRVTLNNKSEVYDEVDLTVLPYIYSGPFTFEAQETEGAQECVLTGYAPEEGYESELVTIPETVTQGGVEYKVVGIASGAFTTATELGSVSLPASVTKIEDGAFTACTKLHSVFMTDHTTLDGFTCGENAFAEVEGGTVYLNSELKVEASPIPQYEIGDLKTSIKSMELVPPAKTEYVLGDPLDEAGMQVTGVLQNGSKITVTDYEIHGYDPDVTGEQEVQVVLRRSKVFATFKVQVSFPEIAIEEHPEDAAYRTGAEMEPLRVGASAYSGTLTYQWYKGASADGSGEKINGATEAGYRPTEAGSYYAEVRVEDANGATSDPIYSEVATINVGDYAAAIGSTGYASLADAIEQTTGDVNIRLLEDTSLSKTVSIAGGRTISINGGGFTVTRASSFKDALISVNGATMNLTNVVFDGGAVWEGEADEILGRGRTNKGRKESSYLVTMSNGANMTLGTGFVMQNVEGTGHQKGAGIEANKSSLTVDGAIFRDIKGMYGSAINMKDASQLTIRSGVIEGVECDWAGAIYNINPGSVTSIEGGTFQNNLSTNGQHGGAVLYSNRGAVKISGGEFTNNKAFRGGVLFVDGDNAQQRVEISGGTFAGNRAAKGGVVHLHGYPVTLSISGGDFVGNSATETGGAVDVRPESTNTVITVTGGTFTGNSADVNGGAICTPKSLTVSNATFSGNTAKGNGGAVYASQVSSVADSTFSNNAAEGNGGALYTTVDLKVTGSSFDGNEAQVGGALWTSGTVVFDSSSASNNTAQAEGGAIYTPKTVNASGSAVSGNTAVTGGAVYADSNVEFKEGEMTDNSAQNGGAIWTAGSASVTSARAQGNVAEEHGGAVCAAGAVTSSLSDFEENEAKAGAAVWTGDAFSLNGGSFTGNKAEKGAAAYLANAEAKATIGGYSSLETIHLAGENQVELSVATYESALPLTMDGNLTQEMRFGTARGDAKLAAATMNGAPLVLVQEQSEDGKSEYRLKLADGWMSVDQYRGEDGYTAPEAPEGMVFAGWYTTDDPANLTKETALGRGVISGMAWAHFVPIDGVLTFKGGSLRMDNATDYKKTNLRFGYETNLPEGMTYDPERSGWDFGFSADTLTNSTSVKNYRVTDDGAIVANLLITNVPAQKYDTTIYVRARTAYTTVDGTSVVVEDAAVQDRSVAYVVNAIIADPNASQEEKDYAEKLQEVMNGQATENR